MASRLPNPGSDDGTWGTILNDYLSQSLTATGGIKTGVVASAQLADASITTPKLATSAAPTTGQVLGYDGSGLAWTTASGGGGAVSSVNSQTGAVTLAKNDIGLGNVDNTADTAKPLSDATVNALALKADDSATVHTSGNETITGVKNFTGTLQSGGQTVVATNDARLTNTRTPSDGSVTEAKLSAGAGTNGQVLSSNGSGGLAWTTNTSTGTITDATSSAKGVVQLAGDLSGTAGAPSVAKVNGIAVSGTPSTGQVLTASGTTAATWQTPSAGGVTSVAGRTGVVVIGESDVTNLTADLAAKAPLASPTFTGTVLTPALRVSGGTPASGKVLTSDATGIATWQTVSATASDATTTTNGIVRLAGDLGGTAAAPTTPTAVHLAGAETITGVKAFSASPTVPTPTTPTQAANKTYVDSVAPTDATTIANGIVRLAGDLGGTAAAPTVAKVNGITVTGTPTTGQVLTASSTTAATWSTASGGGSALTVKDEGTNITTAATSLNFAGAGVTATNASGAVTVTIPGGSGGSGFPAWNIVHQTASVGNAAYTATAGDWVIIDATAHGMTVTLPAAVANATVLVKKTDAGGLAVSVVGPGGTLVDDPIGAYSLNQPGAAGQYLSDGTNWYAISNY